MSMTGLEYEIGKDVFITSKILRRYIDSRVECSEISGVQGRILGRIVCEAEKGNELYQKDMESELHIRGASVTNMLQLMEKKGLIKRVRSEKDSRLKCILPTEDGVRVHKIINSHIRQAEEDLLSLFTEDELEIFGSMMERLKNYASEGKGGKKA